MLGRAARGAVGLLLALTAACSTTPAADKRAVFLEPALVSARVADGVAQGNRAVEALARVTAADGRFAVSSSATDAPLRGWTDLLPGDDPGTLRVYYRVVDPGAHRLLASVSATVSLRGAWPWTFLQRWTRTDAAASDRVEKDWDAALDEALRASRFDEALRLADWVADRDPERSKGLRELVAADAQKAAAQTEESKLVAWFSAPAGSPTSEALLRIKALDEIRFASETTTISSGAAAAFQKRFGTDLDSALRAPALIVVPGGTFFAGTETGEADERPAHRVTLSSFLIARTEVTQEQFLAVTGNNPSLFNQTADALLRPVERVTWFDALEFCNLLSLKEGLEPVYTLTHRSPATGGPIRAADVVQNRARNGYRLPTEAEWEWAARGASLVPTTLSGGEDPARLAWTDGSAEGPAPVAEREANALGLYDLSGNVWEWCWDWYGPYEAGSQTDPEGPASGILRVGRGGSWHAAAWNARVTARSFDNPSSRSSNLGFRVARTLSLP